MFLIATLNIIPIMGKSKFVDSVVTPTQQSLPAVRNAGKNRQELNKKCIISQTIVA